MRNAKRVHKEGSKRAVNKQDETAPVSIASGPLAILALETIIYGAVHLLLSISEQLSEMTHNQDCSKQTRLAAFGARVLADTQADALLTGYEAAMAERKAELIALVKAGGR